MGRIIGLEIEKMVKRRLTWWLLLLLVAWVLAMQVGLYALTVSKPSAVRGADGQTIPLSAALQNYTLPGAVPSTLQVAQLSGGVLLIVLTAVALGMEESYGTLRIILSTGVGRARYLAGKLGMLAVMIVVFVLAALIAGVLAALVVGATARTPIQPTAVAGSAALASAGMALRTMGVLCLPVALTFCATVLSRSRSIGQAVGLGYVLVFDSILGLALDGLGATALRPLVPGRDIAAILALNRFGPCSSPVACPQTAGLPPVPVAALALLAYTALFVVGAWLAFRRRDIAGSAG